MVDLSDDGDLSASSGQQNMDQLANQNQQMLPAMQMIHGVHPSQQQPVFHVPPGMQVIPIPMQQMQQMLQNQQPQLMPMNGYGPVSTGNLHRVAPDTRQYADIPIQYHRR